MPTYNCRDLIADTLHPLLAAPGYFQELIIIDNGSNDGTKEFIQNRYPDITLIANSHNRGASAARNQGIDRAQEEYILCMDCDVMLSKGFFKNLKRILKKLPESVAAISPKTIQSGTDKIFSCGLAVSSLLRTHDIGKNKDTASLGKRKPIDGPNTCCAIYRKKYLDLVKEHSYFDEDFFFIGEDADLALRFKEKGFLCLMFPQLTCSHRGKSSGFSDQRRRYFSFRNRLYMILKHYRGKNMASFFIRSFFYDVIRTVHFFLTNKYAFNIFSDLYEKWQKEKNNHI